MTTVKSPTELDQLQRQVTESLFALQQEQDRLVAQEDAVKRQKAVIEHLGGVLCDAIEECQRALGTKDPIILADGTQLKVESKYYGNISKENFPLAMEWLAKHKFDNLLKTRVTVEFGQNELGMARRFEEILRASIPQYPVAVTILDDFDGLPTIEALLQTVVLAREIESETTMHSSTLKAFVKKQLLAGKDFPAELFGAFERREPMVKLPKKDTEGAS